MTVWYTRAQKTTTRIVLAIAASALLAEGVLRLAGAVDFPTYGVDDQIGYVVNPNQAGSFLHQKSWAFNDRSMGTADAWEPARRPNILLIGNSIVMGGNPYDQAQRLGVLLQRRLDSKAAIWPIATGGWTNVNETVYLERNPDVVAATNLFVWEIMGGGLSQLSSWRGDSVFPRRRPLFATWYIMRRYVLPRLMPMNVSELPPAGKPQEENVRRFEAMVARLSKSTDRMAPGILLLYPRAIDLSAARRGMTWLPELGEIKRIAARYGLRVFDLSSCPEWRSDFYRDGVHPTVEGNVVLARLLSDQIADMWQG